MAIFLQKAFAAVHSATIGRYLPIVQIAYRHSDKCNKEKETKSEKKKEKKGEKKKEDPYAKKQEEKKQQMAILAPVPKRRYDEVLAHITPIFMREETLSHCFPADASGARAADFRAYAAQLVRSELSVTALSDPHGPVAAHLVAACLSRALPASKVMGVDVEALVADLKDPLLKNILKMLTWVHQDLDLFGVLGVDKVLEIGLVSVEAGYSGHGLGTKVVKASLALGAGKGLEVVKVDCTGIASAKICQKSGMKQIYSLPFDEYKPEGQIIFAGTKPPNHVLRVYAGRVHRDEPHVTPLTDFKLHDVNDA